MGGEERAAARDALMELKGLRLVQIDRPSEEDAADKEVQSRMRTDGFVEIETFIPVEMLMTVWPAAASAALDPDKAFREIELPNWDSTKEAQTLTLASTLTLTTVLNGQVCSDKRFPQYLGKLVIKSGVTEAEAMAGLARYSKLAEIRVAEGDAIAAAEARAKAEEIAPMVRARANLEAQVEIQKITAVSKESRVIPPINYWMVAGHGRRGEDGVRGGTPQGHNHSRSPDPDPNPNTNPNHYPGSNPNSNTDTNTDHNSKSNPYSNSISNLNSNTRTILNPNPNPDPNKGTRVQDNHHHHAQ